MRTALPVRSLSRLGLFLFILCFFIPGVDGHAENTVYFYNPESNLDNFAMVKTRLDAYLVRFGSYRFQAFADRETFEEIVEGKKDGILILSSWHYGILKEKLAITPVLVGVVDGKTTQKKVLYAQKKN